MRHPDLAASARRFAALGDPTRLQVFLLLAREPQSVAEIAGSVSVSRPAVSQPRRAALASITTSARGSVNAMQHSGMPSQSWIPRSADSVLAQLTDTT